MSGASASFSILEIPLFFLGWGAVAMVIAIIFVIGGFGWKDLVGLAASTVPLWVSNDSQLFDYNCQND